MIKVILVMLGLIISQAGQAQVYCTKMLDNEQNEFILTLNNGSVQESSFHYNNLDSINKMYDVCTILSKAAKCGPVSILEPIYRTDYEDGTPFHYVSSYRNITLYENNLTFGRYDTYEDCEYDLLFSIEHVIAHLGGHDDFIILDKTND